MPSALAVLRLLTIAILVAFPTLLHIPSAYTSPPEDVSGRYTSPEFGWSIDWSSPWTRNFSDEPDSAGIELILDNEMSQIVITGFALKGAPIDCVAEITRSSEPVGLVPPNALGTQSDGRRVWSTFRTRDGETRHVDCRELESGNALLAIVHYVSPAASYGEQEVERQTLLASLTIDGEGVSGTPDDSPATAEPGFIKGKVTNVHGEPIAGVAIDVTERDSQSQCESGGFWGTDRGPCTTGLRTVTDAEGNYVLEAESDRRYDYWIHPFHEVTVDGHTMFLELHPVDNDRSWESAELGIVEDFQWRVWGERPTLNGTPEPAVGPTDYHGGSIHVIDAFENWSPLDERYPDESFIELVLEPEGPLLDGSESQVLISRLDLQGNSRDDADAEDGLVLDVPIGSYVASATLYLPDGETLPLELKVDCSLFEESQRGFRQFVDIEFGADPFMFIHLETLPLCVATQ